MEDRSINSLLFPLPNTTKTFKFTDRAHNTSSKLQSFYEQKKFFDVVLIAGDDRVKLEAHKIVLSACSDFFETMFSSNMAESNAPDVEIKGVDGLTMKSIVDFMYSGLIELSSDTLEAILIAADFLQMNSLVIGCCDFMVQHLDASNCLGFASFAEQYKFSYLEEISTAYACRNFEKVCNETQFFQLKEEQLRRILLSDELCTHSEDQVFNSLIKWIAHEKKNREQIIMGLLANIRYTLLDPKFIIDSRELLRSDSYDLIGRWIDWHESPESRSTTALEDFKPRKNAHKLAYASGEYITDMKIQTFDTYTNTWSFEDLPCPPKQREMYSAIVVNRKLIIVGGNVDEVSSNSVECLDLKTKEWTELPSMHVKRNYPGLAVLRGDLYVVGGCCDDIWECSVEKYNFATCEWQNMAPLSLPFAWITVTVQGKYLYAIGNRFPAMECYDPDTNRWSPKSYKFERLLFVGFAAVDKYIYAIGGLQEGRERSSTTAERYDPCTDTWSEICSLHEPRGEARCIGLGSKLLVCGGIVIRRSTDGVREYDPATDKWTSLPCLLEHEVDYACSNLFTM